MKQLEEQWNPSEHIEHLLGRAKEQLEELAGMRGKAAHTAEGFIEHTYMATKMPRQLGKDCEKWKAKRAPAGSRSAKAAGPSCLPVGLKHFLPARLHWHPRNIKISPKVLHLVGSKGLL